MINLKDQVHRQKNAEIHLLVHTDNYTPICEIFIYFELGILDGRLVYIIVYYILRMKL